MSDVPPAQIVQDGKLAGPRPKYKRRLSNFMLDKKLQLRYVLFVTILSAVIASSLGFLIYHQRHAASESIEGDLAALTQSDSSLNEFRSQIAEGMASDDRGLVYKMVGVGVALVLILSLYLVIMTHKVAGPLFKVSMYFDKMAEGKLGRVTALRKGDMLQDFFNDFREMHEASRARMQSDADGFAAAAKALREKAGDNAELAAALDALDAHVTTRKQALS